MKRVTPFNVGNLLFRDARNMGEVVRNRHGTKWEKLINANIASTERPGLSLCDANETANRLTRAWEREQTQDADAVYETFRTKWYLDQKDSIDQPAGERLTLWATGDNGPAGGIVLYNIAKERENPSKLQITACPAPGFSSNARADRVHDYLIRNELVFEDGTLLDIAEFRFPVEDARQVWKDEWLEMVASLSDEDIETDEDVTGEERLRRVRRRGALPPEERRPNAIR